jgi:hypothetical protein
MPNEKETIENLKKCTRFNYCSINICPLDLEANLRNELPEEELCPFSIKKRGKEQKGIKTQAPDSILEVIPESNLKLLHRRNQKRWYDLRQKNEQ